VKKQIYCIPQELSRTPTASCCWTSCPNTDLIADVAEAILLLSCKKKADLNTIQTAPFQVAGTQR